MEIAELVLEYLKALAWPFVVLVGLGFFRRELRRLMNSIRSLKLPGGTEISLADLVDKAEEKAQEIEVEKPPADTDALLTDLTKRFDELRETAQRLRVPAASVEISALDLDYYRGIARTDPNLALAALRMGIEIMLQEIAAWSDIEIDLKRSSLMKLAEVLQRSGILPRELRSLLRDLTTVANFAVHGEHVTAEDALRTIDAAEPLRRFYLEWLAKRYQ